MIPTDQEFSILYLSYFVMFSYLVLGNLFSKRQPYFAINLIALLMYLGFLVTIFVDPQNFKGGMSLVVLGKSALFLIIHLGILLLLWFYKVLVKKQFTTRG